MHTNYEYYTLQLTIQTVTVSLSTFPIELVKAKPKKSYYMSPIEHKIPIFLFQTTDKESRVRRIREGKMYTNSTPTSISRYNVSIKTQL